MTKPMLVKGLMMGLGGMLLSTTVAANTLNLGLNNDTIEAGVGLPFGMAGRFVGNYLYHKDQGKQFELGVQTEQDTGISKVTLGAKYVKLRSKTRVNGQAVALGGSYKMTVMPATTLLLGGDYAPSVLASNGADRYYRIDAKLMYELMPTADVGLGYRDVHYKFENQPEQTLDQSFYVGAELKF